MCYTLSEKSTRHRISLTLTEVYLDALDQLVEEGLYMEQQDAIRDALRRLFRHHEIDPFTDKGAELDTADVDQE